MEPNSSSLSVSESYEDEHDVSNLTDYFADLGFAPPEGRFHGVPIVIFDIDTTKGDKEINEICQIAAWCKYKTFKIYMLPENDIAQHASKITGFSIVGGTLHHYGNEVNALPPIEGLTRFLDYLKNQTGQTHGVLLAAHGCFSHKMFHRHILVRLMRKYALFGTFQSLVLGFIDTIPVFKTILTGLAEERESFSLGNLATYYLGENAFPVTHAVVKVEIVSLIVIIECTDAMLAQRAESLDEFIRFIDLKHAFGNVTKYMLKKIARAGISFERLEEEYNANGAEGVTTFLLAGGAGHARLITAIEIINEKLAELFGNENAN